MIQNKIVSIIGHKGYGKTKLTEIVTLHNEKPAIIADPRYQYEPKPWRIHFQGVGQFRKWIMNRRNLKAFYDAKLELVVQRIDPEEFRELTTIVHKMPNITYLVDEIDMFAPPTMTNKDPFYGLIHYGRHNRLDIITTSRRPANVSRNLTSQTDLFLFARVRENTDKKYIANYIGEEHVKTVERLPKFSFLMVDDDLNAKVIKVPKKVAEMI